MSLVRDGQAPYAPTPAVLAVIEAFRQHNPRTPVTAENVSLIDGITESLAPRTVQALRLLGLLDGEGEPTTHLVALKEARPDEFPDRLAAVIKEAYAEIFAYRDPTTANPEDIVEAFRQIGFRPTSMRDRMVRLFYGLCEAAGIIGAAPTVPNLSQRSPRKPVSTTGATTNKKQPQGPKGQTTPPPRPPAPPPAGAVSLDALKARYVELLLKKLEESDGEMNVELADRIERIIGLKPE